MGGEMEGVEWDISYDFQYSRSGERRHFSGLI